MNELLFSPTHVGSIDLPYRIAMAPMTRSRAAADGSPTELNAEYYAQRASIGLVITEGAQPSDDGQGYLTTPGIYTDDHVASWRRVTDAVHAAGGRIVVQLMHTGRIGHPANTPHGRPPVAPSAVAAAGQIFTPQGMLDFAVPRALAASEIAATVDDFRIAAAAAIRAGADGVEIHGANGYLLHQFLSSNANQRHDRYGGGIRNRIRFAVEVAEAVADEIGQDRTGLQISPGNPFNDIVELDTVELYRVLASELAPLGLAYLHVALGANEDDRTLLRDLRETWPTSVIVNPSDATVAARAAFIEDKLADVVTFGRMALANPDLVERLRRDAPLNEPDRTTFYGGGEHGYTDYAVLAPHAEGS